MFINLETSKQNHFFYHTTFTSEVYTLTIYADLDWTGTALLTAQISNEVFIMQFY